MATKAKNDATSTSPKGQQPGDALRAQFAQALAQVDAGKLKEAAAAFEGLLAACREQGEFGLLRSARNYLAAIQKRQEKPAEAAPEPGAEAVLLLNRRDADGALAVLDKALKTHRDCASLHFLKATAHAQKGEAEASAGSLKQALELDGAFLFQYRSEPDFEVMRRSACFAPFEQD